MKIGVIMGGISSERIFPKTLKGIIANLNKEKYQEANCTDKKEDVFSKAKDLDFAL